MIKIYDKIILFSCLSMYPYGATNGAYLSLIRFALIYKCNYAVLCCGTEQRRIRFAVNSVHIGDDRTQKARLTAGWEQQPQPDPLQLHSVYYLNTICVYSITKLHSYQIVHVPPHIDANNRNERSETRNIFDKIKARIGQMSKQQIKLV